MQLIRTVVLSLLMDLLDTSLSPLGGMFATLSNADIIYFDVRDLIAA